MRQAAENKELARSAFLDRLMAAPGMAVLAQKNQLADMREQAQKDIAALDERHRQRIATLRDKANAAQAEYDAHGKELKERLDAIEAARSSATDALANASASFHTERARLNILATGSEAYLRQHGLLPVAE